MDTRLNSQRKRTAGSPENFHPQKFEIRKITSFLPSKISILDLWGLILSWIRFFLQKETAPRKTHRAPFRNTRFPPVSLLRKKKNNKRPPKPEKTSSLPSPPGGHRSGMAWLCALRWGDAAEQWLCGSQRRHRLFSQLGRRKTECRDKNGGNIPSKGGNQEIGEFLFFCKRE